MKQHLEQLIQQSITAMQTQGLISSDLSPSIQIEYTRDKQHGDFACNIALLLAKPAGRKPREIAEAIVQHLPASSLVKEVQIAGPGFINFFMVADALHSVISKILVDGANYGRSEIGKDRNIHIEYVSSNPTGPLHVGHGRSAAYGAAVADLLRAIGCRVHREYYVNDAGRQMNILATSLWLRYLQACGESITFPKNGYQGEYIKTIAAELLKNKAKHCAIVLKQYLLIFLQMWWSMKIMRMKTPVTLKRILMV
jgi:arginyl-tRNA synthetase